MSDAIETARELATHAADIKHLQDDMDKLVSDMDDIKKTLQAINSTLSEAKGGWKVLMMLGGAVLPPLQNLVADKINIYISYFIPALCVTYLAFYGWKINSSNQVSPYPEYRAFRLEGRFRSR